MPSIDSLRALALARKKILPRLREPLAGLCQAASLTRHCRGKIGLHNQHFHAAFSTIEYAAYHSLNGAQYATQSFPI